MYRRSSILHRDASERDSRNTSWAASPKGNTMADANIQVWQDACDDHKWIVSREDGECSKTLSAHDDRDAALQAAQAHLGKGHELLECHDCGVWVEPQADSHGVGSHCPHCNATL